MEKRQLPEEMSQGKLKEAENMKEELMPTPKKTNFEGKLPKMMSLVVDLLKK